ncbi:TPA: Rpn family recombination-promoting nuclease/putative transposase [Salmonella enterica]
MSESDNPSCPHDSFFKLVMSRPEAEWDFLTLHLPPDLLEVSCDIPVISS